MSGVGIVIGAGIYVLIGSAAAEAGNAVWLAFLLAALMSALTGLSYAELASMFPTASAEYEFARQAFNEFLAFLSGWAMLFAYMIAAAAVSIGFSHYLAHFVDVDARIASGALLVVLTAIVIVGLERSIWLTALLVILQIGGLLLVIFAGLPHLGQNDLLEGSSAGGVLRGAALVFFAFIGFDDIVTLSEETSDPRRNMPRALLLALGISTLLYVLVGVAAISLVGGADLAASDRPLTLVIEHNWGSAAGDIVAVIALAATTNTTLLILTAASRIVYGMAYRGSLPRQLTMLGRRGRAPVMAALLVLVVAVAFAMIGDIDVVASATDLAVYSVFVLANLSLIALRFKLPATPRGFRVPGSIGHLPVTPVLALLTVVLMMAFLSREAWLIGAGAMLVGVAVYLALLAGRRLDA